MTVHVILSSNLALESKTSASTLVIKSIRMTSNSITNKPKVLHSLTSKKHLNKRAMSVFYQHSLY